MQNQRDESPAQKGERDAEQQVLRGGSLGPQAWHCGRGGARSRRGASDPCDQDAAGSVLRRRGLRGAYTGRRPRPEER